jgi:hypothetical protein
MVVEFENSFYAQAYSEGNPLDKKVFKESPQFLYKEPGFSEYSNFYTASGWFGRKIIAIPAAAWAVIIKTLYHLANAIFCGLPRIPSDGGLYFKAQIFSIVRDLQESFGRILSIFQDRSGLFHIQQAQFYKSCYECFYEDDTVPFSHPTTEADKPFQNSNNQLSGRSSYDIRPPISEEAHERVRKFNEESQRKLKEAQGIQQQYKQECLKDFKSLVEEVDSKINGIEQNLEEWKKEMQKDILFSRIKIRVDWDVGSGAISKKEVYSVLEPYFGKYPNLKAVAEG